MSHMDSAIHIMAKVLTVLGIVGAIGCALVIPKTAYDLFSTFFIKPDEEEDEAPRVVASASDQVESEDEEEAIPESRPSPPAANPEQDAKQMRAEDDDFGE
jgi:hypothetical protein